MYNRKSLVCSATTPCLPRKSDISLQEKLLSRRAKIVPRCCFSGSRSGSFKAALRISFGVCMGGFWHQYAQSATESTKIGLVREISLMGICEQTTRHPIGSAQKFGVRYRYCVDSIQENLWPCNFRARKSSAAGSASGEVRAEKLKNSLRFFNLASKVSKRSLELKILVSVVRFRPRPPNTKSLSCMDFFFHCKVEEMRE